MRERGKEKEGDEEKRAICTKASRKARKQDSKKTRMYCFTLNLRTKPHNIRYILSGEQDTAWQKRKGTALYSAHGHSACGVC